MKITEENIKILDIRKSIKSFIIIKRIFSLLTHEKKLIIISCNKNLQDNFGINIEDYKKLSRKILYLGINGYGEEFDSLTNTKIFEGKYLKGKRNGFGKEFNSDEKIIFEGEYLNGKKIEGTGYDNKGNIILKLEKNGEGKEYFNNGNLKFVGNYINGKRFNGKGYNYYGMEEYVIKYGKGFV